MQNIFVYLLFSVLLSAQRCTEQHSKFVKGKALKPLVSLVHAKVNKEKKN